VQKINNKKMASLIKLAVFSSIFLNPKFAKSRQAEFAASFQNSTQSVENFFYMENVMILCRAKVLRDVRLIIRAYHANKKR
jgi:hypothetical protein